MTLLLCEFQRALKNTSFKLALLLLLLCGVLAVGYGRSQMDRQSAVLDQLPTMVRESDEAYFKERMPKGAKMGSVSYYLSQPTAHRPLPQAALSLGQRDLHSYHQSVRLRSLYTNLFDAGFENPRRTAAGHFDLAFVLVFLLPLVVIASTYDLLSRERENKTLPLLRSSGTPLAQILLAKLAARFVLISLVSSVLVTGAFLAVGAKMAALGPWLVLTNFYLIFWLGVCSCVIGRGLNSAMSAGVLLGVWTFFTIICPALLSLLLPREATQNGADLTIRCRQVINNAWDRDKMEAIKAASKVYPNYKNAPVYPDKFTWAWYFAMHDAGDLAVEESAETYFQGLAKRDEQAFSYSLLSAPVRAQLLFDRFAGTDLAAHLQYYDFVKETRLKLRDDFLPRVFEQERLTAEEVLSLHDKIQIGDFQPQAPPISSSGLPQFCLLALSFAFLGLFSLGMAEKSITA